MKVGSAVDGSVAPGWEPLLDTFAGGFASGAETGAALAVYVDGEPVADLWGGIADPMSGRRWDRDTITTVMSTTKGAASVAVHRLVEKGVLDLDQPVARYWPQFGAAGKADLTVRAALSHQAGLEYVDRDLTFDELCQGAPVLRALEAQAPHYRPGTKSGYHALTWGFIVGELALRTTGQTLGQIFASEVAGPLGLRAWIGLPAEQERHVAPLISSGPPNPVLRLLMATVLRKAARSITFGSALPMGLVTGEANDMNSRRLREIELPAANLVTDARSLARMYGATVAEVDGHRLLAPQTVETARRFQTTHLPDPRLLGKRLPRRDFGLGFTTDDQMLGPSSFGFFGAGGSLAFADVDAKVGFGYVMNKMDGSRPSHRGAKLARVVAQCLGMKGTGR